MSEPCASPRDAGGEQPPPAFPARPGRVTLQGVELHLSHPDTSPVEWIGQEELLEQLLACWLVVDPRDLPLCPRLVGKPGLGKTTLACAAAKKAGREVYVFQCTMDTRPEDLLVTPVLGERGNIEYHASPVVTAMIAGGACVLDEGNRMSEKSWASLAPLLDHRRYVESIVAGIKIDAHPAFRACVTMNDDASTYELPDYITSRLQPTLELTFPNRQDEMSILRYNVPFADAEVVERTVDFLQRSHELDLDYSTRDGIHMMRYLLKRERDPRTDRDRLWEETLRKVLGAEAADLSRQAEERRRLRGEQPLADLDEFFFGDDDERGPEEEDGEDPERR